MIGENHHDSQQGQLLFSEALGRFRERGCAGAVAITASERAKRLFARCGGQPKSAGDWRADLLDSAVKRYAPEERSQVELFEFPLTERPVPQPVDSP